MLENVIMKSHEIDYKLRKTAKIHRILLPPMYIINRQYLSDISLIVYNSTHSGLEFQKSVTVFSGARLVSKFFREIEFTILKK